MDNCAALRPGLLHPQLPKAKRCANVQVPAAKAPALAAAPSPWSRGLQARSWTGIRAGTRDTSGRRFGWPASPLAIPGRTRSFGTPGRSATPPQAVWLTPRLSVPVRASPGILFGNPGSCGRQFGFVLLVLAIPRRRISCGTAERSVRPPGWMRRSRASVHRPQRPRYVIAWASPWLPKEKKRVFGGPVPGGSSGYGQNAPGVPSISLWQRSQGIHASFSRSSGTRSPHRGLAWG
jgi:hypothetical protein